MVVLKELLTKLSKFLELFMIFPANHQQRLSGNKGEKYNNYRKSFCGKNVFDRVVRYLVTTS